MTGYLVRRVGQMGLTLFLIITLTFFLVEAQPGDYASIYVLNPDLPPDVKDQIRAAFGLDKPVWQQYLIHLRNTFSGNFGFHSAISLAPSWMYLQSESRAPWCCS